MTGGVKEGFPEEVFLELSLEVEEREWHSGKREQHVKRYGGKKAHTQPVQRAEDLSGLRRKGEGM